MKMPPQLMSPEHVMKVFHSSGDQSAVIWTEESWLKWATQTYTELVGPKGECSSTSYLFIKTVKIVISVYGCFVFFFFLNLNMYSIIDYSH